MADVQINLHGRFGYHSAQIHTSKILGRGSYGSVVKATLDYLPCAAKILHATFFRDDDPGAVDFEKECTILQELKHPCIVQFLGVVQDPTSCRPILLMELMDESLTCFLQCSSSSLPYHMQVNITYNIAQALAYLHGNHIFHRDLSSNNILLKGAQAKVTDFGMSKIANPSMTHSKTTRCLGTPAFMPPEALRAEPCYSDKLDTFSLGVLIIQIITLLFPEPTKAEIIMKDVSAPTGSKIVLVPERERRRKDISNVPPDHPLLPIALNCLKDRDTERPTAVHLCQRLEQLNEEEVSLPTNRMKDEKVEEEPMEISLQQQWMTNIATEKEQQQQMKNEKVIFSHAAPTDGLQGVMAKRFPKPDEKALYDAVERGDVSTVQQIIACDVNVDCTPYTRDGWTPLMEASFKGHVDIVRRLIEAKAHINKQNERGETALHLATKEGKVDAVRLLTEAHAQVDIQTEDGETPLFFASYHGHSDVVNILIRNGADINMAKKDVVTPLFIASQEGHRDVVNTLLSNGADANMATKDGETPLLIASYHGQSDVVNILIRKITDVNMAKKDGATPLYIASQQGHCDVVNILLRNGANDGETPLFIASFHGHSDVVNILIRNGADVNMTKKDGATPLYIASQEGHSNIANILVRSGADVNIAAKDGVTPLFIASYHGHSDVVNMLIKNGVDVNIAKKDGATPLFMASLQGHGNVVDILISDGADINLSCKGTKPIDIARSEGHTAIVCLLRRHGN